MIAFALSLLTTTSVFAAEAEEEVYLTALAVDVEPQGGWYIERWSDWDFDAVDKGETTKVHFFSSPFQVEVTEDAAQAWGELAVEELEALEHTDGQVTEARVAQHGDAAVGEATISFSYQGKHPAVLYLRSFPIQGNTAHVAAFSVARRARTAQKALDTWSEALTFERGPDPVPADASVAAEAMGYGTTLPEGYRAPLKSELSVARNLAAETGQTYQADSCWLGISPHPRGEASVLVSCQAGKWLGILDSYSFEAIEVQLRDTFFKGLEMAPGIGYEHAERLSVIWSPPSRGDKAFRMALTPYDKGVALTYAMGPSDDAASLDAAIRGSLDAMTFTGEGGGAHPTGAAAWIAYAAQYRPAFLVGGAAPFLLLFGLIALKAKNARPSWEDA